MRYTCGLLGFAVLLASPGLFGGQHFKAGPGEDVVPDELLVRLAPGAAESVLTRLSPGGSTHKRLHPATRHFQVHVPPGRAEAVAALLAADPNVEYVEPNRNRSPLATPNDPGYQYEWGLTAVNATRAWSLAPGRFTTASTLV